MPYTSRDDAIHHLVMRPIIEPDPEITENRSELSPTQQAWDLYDIDAIVDEVIADRSTNNMDPAFDYAAPYNVNDVEDFAAHEAFWSVIQTNAR